MSRTSRRVWFFLGGGLACAMPAGIGAVAFDRQMQDMQRWSPRLVVVQQARSPDGRLVATIGRQDVRSTLADDTSFVLIRRAAGWHGLAPHDPVPADAFAVADSGAFLSVAWHGDRMLAVGYDSDQTDFAVRRTHVDGVRIAYRSATENTGRSIILNP